MQSGADFFEKIIFADREWLVIFTFSTILFLLYFLFMRSDLREMLRKSHSKSFIKKQDKTNMQNKPKISAMLKRLTLYYWRRDLPRQSVVFMNLQLILFILVLVLSVPLWLIYNAGAWNWVLRIFVLAVSLSALLSTCAVLYNYLCRFIKYGKDGMKNQGYRKDKRKM